MATTTRTQVPAEVNNFYVRSLLMRAVPRFVHNRWAQIKDIPQNAGTATVKFRRYSNLTAATTALTEGTTPSGSQLAQTTITADVDQYGDFVTVSDVLSYESQDAVLLEAAEILGDQAGDTLDILMRDILVAGTNVQYAGGVASRNLVATNITAAEIKKMVRTLKKDSARYVTTMINPTTGYSTEPVAPGFMAICSPDTTYDLEDLDGFTPIEKYSSQKGVMDGEVGKFKQVRFVETPNAKVFAAAGASSADVHATLIIGKDAYGATRISGKAMENIIKPLGSGGTEDPLNQRATSGWKATFVGLILNDDFMGRIEHTVSS